MNKRNFLKTSATAFLGTALLPHWACNSPAGEKTEQEEQGAAYSPSLPELPYAADALMPYIDKETMLIHHGKHHGGYVKKFAAALEEAQLKGESLEALLAQIDGEQKALRNNGGGHYNHQLFWRTLKPNSSGEQPLPQGDLAQAIEGSFGSLENLLEALKKEALSRFGSGWAWICQGEDKKLFLCSTPNQDNPLMKKIAEKTGKPLFGIDVWEHAYYLNYQNRRADYVDAVFKLIHWEEVAKNLG